LKAIILQEHGSPEGFCLSEIPKPKIEPGKVIIQVCATSVNPVDCKIRSGILPGISPKLPGVLHGDIAGIIAEVGTGVSGFKVGDEIYGCVGGFTDMPGVLVEYAMVDARLVAKKPRDLLMLETAALPLVSITTWNALVDRGKVSCDQKVLIYGGTGGVGHVAIQLAKALGAEIHTIISSARKAEIAKALGADKTFSYTHETHEQSRPELPEENGYDLVFDTVGGGCLDQSFQAAKEYGTVVSIASRASHDLTLVHVKSLSLHVVFMLLPLLRNQYREKHGKILSQITNLADQGKIIPLIHEQSFSFDEVGKAHDCWESGQATGKIVLENKW
jgi:NADPH2:quinone reductase